MAQPTPRIVHHFVDEAGDLTLFDRRGRSLLGVGGVSHTFMLGVAELDDPDSATAKLGELRTSLLGDPYFANVPSMQPATKKTTLAFHAKDDLPEVRREVFRLLPELNPRIFVAIRRKAVLSADFRAYFRRTGIRKSADLVYDDLVTRLFKERLHLADENRIVFARRGKADRNVAVGMAIQRAKGQFEQRWKKGIDRPTTIRSSVPSQEPGLQVIDYYLWALQRMVERREERFFQILAPAYRLILDKDDQRRGGYGGYYTARNLITLETLMPVL